MGNLGSGSDPTQPIAAVGSVPAAMGGGVIRRCRKLSFEGQDLLSASLRVPFCPFSEAGAQKGN